MPPPPTRKICSLFVTFTSISGALRTSCIYPNQGLAILTEVFGYTGPVLWNELSSELRKQLQGLKRELTTYIINGHLHGKHVNQYFRF